ncbi:hypothetical protein ANCCAN_03116 [Ancylostoma caninum]|uniref:Uncharacterized protein n=1 Tax=Ancylostoma caninum TaxID=29170 RepID=A0A368H294_ANCCA|nr:hypothetical protein ANCCAN_03116 [Ancylostoma caninum]
MRHTPSDIWETRGRQLTMPMTSPSMCQILGKLVCYSFMECTMITCIFKTVHSSLKPCNRKILILKLW